MYRCFVLFYAFLISRCTFDPKIISYNHNNKRVFSFLKPFNLTLYLTFKTHSFFSFSNGGHIGHDGDLKRLAHGRLASADNEVWEAICSISSPTSNVCDSRFDCAYIRHHENNDVGLEIYLHQIIQSNSIPHRCSTTRHISIYAELRTRFVNVLRL